ncbi:hypothetical protein MKO06_00545 [Gramella sp. GC03-9]|uniref:Alpha/beta hydrolase n=1 Tax=Christiangramia oceanisediminis TaxID=2920386 RepID=A0A9X2I2Y8_9FLAO|nr:hypothetical protein [Gramella oceanisediminis]MCP9198377.1 hypothetical protein [Gramella oceanisediminis]
MRKLLSAIIVIFFISPIALSQEYRIAKGRVTDSLSIPGSEKETFSLFAPSNYSTDKQWPVIFVFDPKGRGRNVSGLFQPAAENQGYLVASANIDLTKRPIDSILTTATSMMRTVMTAFSVNPELVYAAGLGEGAQIASALPIFYKDIAGVMAIGNSFVNRDMVNRNNPYMFIGVGGNQDYMVYQIEEYLRFFDKLGFPTDVYYFEGREDQWPESDVISNAMSGFTLQAIRQGKRNSDEEFRRYLFEKELAYAEKLRRTRNYFSAYQKLERMEDKYDDFGFDDEIKEKMKEVKAPRNFNSQRREFRQATQYEKEQQDEYEFLMRTDIMSANFENIGWWAYQMDELDKLKENPSEAKSNMAYRLHGYLDFISRREFDAIMKVRAPIDTKMFIAVLRTVINKTDPEAYFKIISLASLDGDTETALLYLEDLLKTGYSNREALYNIEGTLGLRMTPEFNSIIEKYLEESKFPAEAPVDN